MKEQHSRPLALIAGRFDADAAALLTRVAEGKDPATHARPYPDTRRSVDRRRHHGRPLRTAGRVPVERRTCVDLPCQSADLDLWFADDPADLERAKTLCADCPARVTCLTGAVDRREAAGVWGGQIFDRGQIVTYKRPPGRPRNGSAKPQRLDALPESA